MLGGLARNTAFSAVAFGLNGLVSLALVPVIVGAYGLPLYGLIVLSRALLPAGALGILDLGVAETTTQAVGRARGSGDWIAASERIGLLLAISAAVGVALAAVLVIFASPLATTFGAPESEHRSYAAVLAATGACLLLCFPGLVAEGVLKGFERFGALRAVEVSAMIGYAGVTLAAISARLSYAAVAYAFLGTMALRYAVIGAIAWVAARRAGLRFSRWGEAARAEVMRRSRLMFHNKLLGALQTPIPPLVIGVLVGPSGVGLYDVITRIPRFLKSTLSLLASAVLPVAARLEGRGAHERLRALAKNSFWLVPYAAFPVLFAVAGLSSPILELWVGPKLAAHWPWLVAMLVFPVLNISLNVSQAMLQISPDYIAGANRISTAAVVLQFFISIAFVRPLGAMSFVLGVALAAVAAFPFHLRLIGRTLNMTVRAMLGPVSGHAVLALAMACVLGVLSRELAPIHAMALIGTFFFVLAAYWAGAYWLLLDGEARGLLGRLASSLLRRAGT